MEYHHLKNEEAHHFLDGIGVEDIMEIHEEKEPSYNLRNLMLGMMCILDLP